jgi:ketosteroid isomerase-like protein
VTTQHAADEAGIRQQIAKLVEAVRAIDLDAVESIYAPDIVSFDVGPPLQHVGTEAKLGNWINAVAAFQAPLGYEFRDLTIIVGGDVAFAHGFGRLSGTLKNGANMSGFWVRATSCFRKVNGNWLITHEHVSVPLDVESGRALVNLEP